MNPTSLLKVYLFYDKPITFSCLTTSGQKYLVIWLGDDLGVDQWLYVPVSDERLEMIEQGKISLREACLKSEKGWVWIVTDNAGPFGLRPVQLSCLQEDYLPGEDLFIA